MNWPLLINSIGVSVGAAALAVLFGFASALFTAGLGACWRRAALGAAALALVVPPFLVTDCWLQLLGHNGVWRSWLPVSIYSLGGTCWLLGLSLWPIPMLACLGAWQQLEPSHLETEPALRHIHLVRWVLLPMARPALAQAAALVLVLALGNFTIPATLQVKVFPAELWVRFSTDFDYLGALALSWPMVVAPLALLLWLRGQNVCWPRLEGAAAPGLLRKRLGGVAFGSSGVAAVVLIGLSVALPLARLVEGGHVWREVPVALRAGQNACFVSFLLAAVTASATVVAGWALWRWPLGISLWLLFLVPGMLLRIGLIFVLNRSVFGLLSQSFAVLVLGSVLRFLPIGWNGAALARRAVDRDLTDAGRLFGASCWQLFRHVHWPQVAPRLALAWYATYLLALWDVETLVLLVPPGAETLGLRIFNLLHYGHNVQVSALCLLLLALALLPAALYAAGSWLRRRAWTPLAALCLAGCLPGSDSPGSGTLTGELFARAEMRGSRGRGAGEFSKPRSLTLDKADHLYVVDMTGRVQKFAPDGAYLAAWQMPQTDLGRPKGMALDLSNRVVVIEPHYGRVNHFSPEGRLMLQWGDRGTNRGQLMFPRAAAINSRGEVWVSEYGAAERVQCFAPDGSRLLIVLGRFGASPGEFNRAEGLAVDTQDRLYVADSCNHRIQVFSSKGEWLRSYGQPGSGRGELSYPYDVQVDATGRQMVCEFGNSRIQVFDPQGRSIEIIGGPGSGPGRFNNPWSIALDSEGNLYVADAGNHRVQKLIRRKPLGAGGHAGAGNPPPDRL